MTTPFTEGTEGLFFSLPAEAYHAAPGCSHTMLKHMEPPARLPEYMATKDDEEPTAAQILGTLTHHRVLEPDAPLPSIAVKPEDMKFSTREGKAWRDAQGGKIILKQCEWDALNGMTASIAAHPLCQTIFREGWSEVSVFRNSVTSPTVLRKMRLDWLPKYGDALVDVKTCTDASPWAFAKAIHDHGYFTQAAAYLDLWNDAVWETEFTKREHFVFIAVEKTPPYLVAVYALHPEALKKGRGLNMERLRIYGECTRDNKWPGFSDDVQVIDLPKWAYGGRTHDLSWMEAV